VADCDRKKAAERAADERDAMERRETAKRLAAERVADCDRKKFAERVSAERVIVEVSVPQMGERLAVEGAVVERLADARGVGHVIAERVNVDETSLEVSIIEKRAASDEDIAGDDQEVGHYDAERTDADQVVGRRSAEGAMDGWMKDRSAGEFNSCGQCKDYIGKEQNCELLICIMLLKL
jgi:hypothetical protein